MKSTIFYLAIILLLFSGKNKNEYTIHGTFKGEPIEKWIYLDKFGESGLADSTRIINGSFEFKGTVDFPELYGLTFHPKKSIGICLLFLEPSNLEIVIDLDAWDINSTVSGGIVNDEYYRLEEPNRKIMELFNEMPNANEERKNQIKEQIAKIGSEYEQLKLDYIKNNPASPISIFLYSMVYPLFTTEEQGEFLKAFDPAIKNTSFYKIVYAEYEATISPETSTPSLAYNTDIKELNIDLKGQPIIETLVNQNPGKTLFVDIWGTWCGPCIAEFPASRNLISSMESKNIAFVYLCLDCDEEPWKNMIQKEELRGQHYSVRKKLLERFYDETGTMMRGGVPRYLIIDESGNVIDDDAPKPSSGRLEEILLNL